MGGMAAAPVSIRELGSPERPFFGYGLPGPGQQGRSAKMEERKEERSDFVADMHEGRV